MKPLRPAILAACLLPALAACQMPAPVPTGAQDFATYCATCHGAGARGDGEMAASLPHRPADLTQLAARNGGTFPATRVMSKIWGYAGGPQGGAVMPGFGALLDGALVPYDGSDGILTPTPERLVQLAEYVRGLQGQ